MLWMRRLPSDARVPVCSVLTGPSLAIQQLIYAGLGCHATAMGDGDSAGDSGGDDEDDQGDVQKDDNSRSDKRPSISIAWTRGSSSHTRARGASLGAAGGQRVAGGSTSRLARGFPTAAFAGACFDASFMPSMRAPSTHGAQCPCACLAGAKQKPPIGPWSAAPCSANRSLSSWARPPPPTGPAPSATRTMANLCPFVHLASPAAQPRASCDFAFRCPPRAEPSCDDDEHTTSPSHDTH